MKTISDFLAPWHIRLCLIIAAGMAWVACYYLIAWSSVEGTTWAAWIQAFGSVAAIIVAIVVMNTQHDRDRREQQAHALAREINFAISVEKFAERLATGQRGLSATAKIKQMDKLTLAYHASVFSALSRMADSMPSWEAGETVAAYLLQLQQNCHVTAAIVESALVEPPKDLKDFSESMAEWAKKANALGQELNQHRVLRYLELTDLRN